MNETAGRDLAALERDILALIAAALRIVGSSEG
jgi:hypothetical protein